MWSLIGGPVGRDSAADSHLEVKIHMKRRFGNWTLVVIVAAIVLLITTSISAQFALHWLQAGRPGSGWFGIVSAIGGGSLVGLVSLGIALWRIKLTQQQIDLTSQNSEHNRQEQAHARYQRSAEMLGDPNLLVRLGGIYTLRALMTEYTEELHIPVMEMLCAFLRAPTDMDTVSGDPGIRQDIQTALDVIVTRGDVGIEIEKAHGFRLDLRYANLQYANLTGGDFSGTNLRGATLSHAIMNEVNLSRTTLDEADISEVNCRGADFVEASFYMTNMFHTSADRSDFSRARIVWSNCVKASFHETNFTRAIIDSCKLDDAMFYDADLTRTYISAGNITQQQLDNAKSEPNGPPLLDFPREYAEKNPLNWHGEWAYNYPPPETTEKQRECGPRRVLNLVSVNRVNPKPWANDDPDISDGINLALW